MRIAPLAGTDGGRGTGGGIAREHESIKKKKKSLYTQQRGGITVNLKK